VTVTRDGRAVAELTPLRPRGLRAAVLVERWRRLPPLDPGAWRRDIDALIDNEL